jgi:hypothetical protein
VKTKLVELIRTENAKSSRKWNAEEWRKHLAGTCGRQKGQYNPFRVEEQRDHKRTNNNRMDNGQHLLHNNRAKANEAESHDEQQEASLQRELHYIGTSYIEMQTKRLEREESDCERDLRPSSFVSVNELKWTECESNGGKQSHCNERQKVQTKGKRSLLKQFQNEEEEEEQGR